MAKVKIAVIVGTTSAWLLYRYRYRGSRAIGTLACIPMVVPEIIMGISLLLFFATLFGGQGSIVQISIAHITFCISYVAIVVRARAAGVVCRDQGMEPWWRPADPVVH